MDMVRRLLMMVTQVRQYCDDPLLLGSSLTNVSMYASKFKSSALIPHKTKNKKQKTTTTTTKPNTSLEEDQFISGHIKGRY